MISNGIDVTGTASFDGTSNTLTLTSIGGYTVGDLTVTIKAWLSVVGDTSGKDSVDASLVI